MNDTDRRDRLEGLYRVSLQRFTRAGYWSWDYTNPQGGGFGSNTSTTSQRRALHDATRNFPAGTRFRLVVNDDDRGVYQVRDCVSAAARVGRVTVQE